GDSERIVDDLQNLDCQMSDGWQFYEYESAICEDKKIIAVANLIKIKIPGATILHFQENGSTWCH
ncbi:MAG: hypothetical protein GY696_08415, partial [Gammaproteobacteria bacterium]|nr:hypothetical protein [Gammaproteobacteria bacterium]